jgi:hypothetical protein
MLLFNPKIVTKLSELWVRDPGSRKNLDPGNRIGQKSTGFRIRTTRW